MSIAPRYFIATVSLMIAAVSAEAETIIAVPALKAGYDSWSRGDYADAVARWRPLAIAGDPVAQFDLAQAYKLGRGVPTDARLAESWFAKAAAQGHVPSRDNYGLILFQNGDRAKAMPYIEESAARGEPRAQYVLAIALFNGDGRERDWVRAYALMTRSSAAGITAASLGLAQMDKNVPLDQRQRGLALAKTLEDRTASTRATAVLADVPLNPAPSSQQSQPQPDFAPAAARTRVSLPVPQGQWRVQLGAFGDAAKATLLWDDLHRRLPALKSYHSILVTAGPVTRLQVGPLAARADAAALCATIRTATPCFPITP